MLSWSPRRPRPREQRQEGVAYWQKLCGGLPRLLRRGFPKKLVWILIPRPLLRYRRRTGRSVFQEKRAPTRSLSTASPFRFWKFRRRSEEPLQQEALQSAPSTSRSYSQHSRDQRMPILRQKNIFCRRMGTSISHWKTIFSGDTPRPIRAVRWCCGRCVSSEASSSFCARR